MKPFSFIFGTVKASEFAETEMKPGVPLGAEALGDRKRSRLDDDRARQILAHIGYSK